MTNLRKAIDAMGDEASLARAMLDSMAPFGNETPVQEEVSAEISHGHGFFALGIVRQCLDQQRAGRILVDSPAFPDGPQSCDYVSPIAGAGYGFFAVPGIGATVLIGKTPYADPPHQNFWFGCLYATGQKELPGQKTQPYVLGQAKQMTKNEVLDNGEPIPSEPGVSYGVPNESDVYQDNDLPDSFVLKHPAGHSISLTDKNTPERQKNEIKLKTAGNKRVIMSDAPAPAGGENILMIDENDNQIRISSIGDGNEIGDDSILSKCKGDYEATTVEGGMDFTISKESRGDFDIDNAGSGDINVTSHQGTIHLTSQSRIVLQVANGSRIIMDKNNITIDANVINVKSNGGDVSIAGNTLLTHVHRERGDGNNTSVGRTP